MKFIGYIPYLIWLFGMRMDAWDWWPGFLIAILLSTGLHYLIFKTTQERN